MKAVFILTAVAYAFFMFGWNQFHNLNLIPGLIMIGSLAGPFTLLILFFEVNVARNVSLYQVLRLMLIGGGLSLIVSLFGFQMTNMSSALGPPAAGIIEEVGKAAALLLVATFTVAAERFADPVKAFVEGYDPSGNDFLANVPERTVLLRIRTDLDGDGRP